MASGPSVSRCSVGFTIRWAAVGRRCPVAAAAQIPEEAAADHNRAGNTSLDDAAASAGHQRPHCRGISCNRHTPCRSAVAHPPGGIRHQPTSRAAHRQRRLWLPRWRPYELPLHRCRRLLRRRWHHWRLRCSVRPRRDAALDPPRIADRRCHRRRMLPEICSDPA